MPQAAAAEFEALKADIKAGKFDSSLTFAKDTLPGAVTALQLYGSAQKKGEYPDAKSKALVK
jgi:hypothetical protein